MSNLFVLFGQTATGKTSKAFELAEKENGEIVNFDSRQIYRKLTIVTGKDLPKSSSFIKHVTYNIQHTNKTIGYYNVTSYKLQVTKLWLYDIVDPKETFSSAEYVKSAEHVLKDILSRRKTPILVGGTGYYLKHLLFGAPKIEVKEDWVLRKKLEVKTVDELQVLLKEKNVQLFEDMNNSDRNNPRRLIRRIEIAETEKSLPTLPPHETLSARLGPSCQNGLTITYLPFFHSSTDIVREKITLRVEKRLKDGALEETKKLLDEGYTQNDPGLNAIGYQQLISHLHNKITLDEAKKQWITKEIQYAKRQKTYFKNLLHQYF